MIFESVTEAPFRVSRRFLDVKITYRVAATLTVVAPPSQPRLVRRSWGTGSSDERSTMANTPMTVSWTRRLEASDALDPVVRAVRPLADALVADPTRRDVLRGAWLGHALHPPLTDVPIGLWTSTLALDLLGGPSSRSAATRLLGLGILTAVPTAVTGWAEWSGTGPREQRVGVAHAASNVLALSLFTSSWLARRSGAHARGRALALAASTALGLGGYLGGHLVSARKVSSRHPEFAEG